MITKSKKIAAQLVETKDDMCRIYRDQMISIYNDPLELVINEESMSVNSSHLFGQKRSFCLKDVGDAVTKAFTHNPHSSYSSFEKMGNNWILVLSKYKNYFSPKNCKNYWIYGVVFKERNEQDMVFTVDLCLISRKKTDLMFLTTFEKDNSEKFEFEQVFEDICYTVKKELRKLEFPEFPEGSSRKSISSVYHISKTLGSGSFGVVYLGQHKETNKKVAVKSIDRDILSTKRDAAIFNEVALLANMDHPHIIKVKDFFINKRYYLLVLEYGEGGDLHDRLKKKRFIVRMKLRFASKIFLKR